MARRAVTSGFDGTMRVWNVESGQEILRYFKDVVGRNVWLAVSPDGHRLFSADRGEREIRYWNVDTGRLIQKLRWAEPPYSGSFTPDGHFAVWGGWDGILREYSLGDTLAQPAARPRRPANTKRRSGLGPVSTPKTTSPRP